MKIITTKYFLKRPIALVLLLTFILLGCAKDEPIKSGEKQITSFVFLLTNNSIDVNVVGIINQETKSISAVMPSGTSLFGLLPEIVVSSGATVNPNTAQDFINSVNYTVTAEDGSTETYSAHITVSLTQREILQIFLDANPGNILGWDLQSTVDLGTLLGISTNVQGQIIRLSSQGKNITTLPPEIGNLISLTELYFGEEKLTSLPPEIGLLNNLLELNVEHNNISNSGIPKEIGNLKKLKKLSFRGNQLTSIPPEVMQLNELEDLDLTRNEISAVPPEIGNLSKLIDLELGINLISTLPIEIFGLNNLEELELFFNELNEIHEEIGRLTNLTKLYLNNNNLSNIPKAIGHLTKLTRLSLNNNSFSSIPPEIGFLTKLEYMNIENTGLINIPKSLWYLDNERNLHLAFSGNIGNLIDRSELDELICISTVNPTNTLGWGVDNYPGVSFENGNPVVLSINDKNLTQFPEGFGLYSKFLKTIHASGNPFGTISSSIGSMLTLEVLTLHDTDISTVPSSFGQLSNLALLTITGNPITSIPQSVCDLQQSNGGILTILTDFGEGCD